MVINGRFRCLHEKKNSVHSFKPDYIQRNASHKLSVKSTRTNLNEIGKNTKLQNFTKMTIIVFEKDSNAKLRNRGVQKVAKGKYLLHQALSVVFVLPGGGRSDCRSINEI